ncbi:MAG: hypothetical protein ACKO37_00570 [Vampirovibrionales bacterium]
MAASKDIITALCRIVDSPTSSINGQNLTEYFGAIGRSLINMGALKAIAHRSDTESMCDHDGKSVEVVRHDGKNCYFSPTAGWVEVPTEALHLYSFCPNWLISNFKAALGIADHVEARAISENDAWSLGSAWLKHAKHPIILVTQLRKEHVFDAVRAYLTEHHMRTPALVIALDHQLPPHAQLPSQNRCVTLIDALNRNDKMFSLNIDYLAEMMGASIQQQGFSSGYRAAYINGQEYTFSKTQAEAIEVMDKAGKPMHQSEILAETSSSQERLIGVFRTKGKTHPAWDVVIVGDGRGNYRLEY